MSFWQEQCPARGPGLTHMHDFEDCGTLHEQHRITQCCECGLNADRRNGPGIIAVVVVEVTDTPSRLDREVDEIVEHYWRDHGGEG